MGSGGTLTQTGRGAVILSEGLEVRSLAVGPGECGDMTEGRTPSPSPSDRGICGRPGGRPKTVRAT